MNTIEPYAVIFKAFVMDGFVKRQLDRIKAAAGAGDVYLMIDETGGSAGPIAFDRVIRYKNADLNGLGFASHAHGALLWYNADYPLYYFQHLHPEYDFIVMMEYDAVPQVSLDSLVYECRNGGLDLIAQPIHKALESYWWTDSMRHFYQDDQIYPVLICAAVFSSRAVKHLAACRLRQGADDAVASELQWPVGEAFVGTELALHGFKIRALASFGQLSRYDWWPPTHESELPELAAQAFIHPVLVGQRYIESLFKNGYVTGLVAMMRLNLPRVILMMLWCSVWQAAQGVITASRHRFLAQR